MNHLEPMMEAKIEQMVLEFMPKGGSTDIPTIRTVIEKIEALCTTYEVRAMKKTFISNVYCLVPLLGNLEKGISPTDREMSKFSPLIKRVMEASANWCTAIVTVKQPQTSPFFGKRNLYGKLALEYNYQVAAEANKSGKKLPLGDSLTDFRRFKWLLCAKAKEQVDEWVRLGCRMARQANIKPMLVDAAPEEDGKDGKVDAASSSSSAAPVKSTIVIAEKKQESQTKLAMQKLFGSKVIVKTI